MEAPVPDSLSRTERSYDLVSTTQTNPSQKFESSTQASLHPGLETASKPTRLKTGSALRIADLEEQVGQQQLLILRLECLLSRAKKEAQQLSLRGGLDESERGTDAQQQRPREQRRTLRAKRKRDEAQLRTVLPKQICKRRRVGTDAEGEFKICVDFEKQV